MNKELKTTDYYKTTDLALCATLISLGYSIDSTEKIKDSEQVTFYIKRDQNLDNVISKVFAGELLVNPFVYFNNLKTVKTRIYNSVD